MPKFPFVRSIQRSAFAALVGVAASLAAAQSGEPKLNPSVYSIDGAFSAAQGENVRDYVSYHVDRMAAAASPQLISDSRDTLLSVMRRPGASPRFRDGYSIVVADALEARECQKHPNTQVRLNAMIIAGRLAGPHGIDIAGDGLADPNPGVRFAASATLLAVASTPAPPDGDIATRLNLHRKMLGIMVPPLAGETSADVRRNLYGAINRLDVEEARGKLIQALDARADAYAMKGIDDSVFAEAEAIAALHRKIVEMWVRAGGNVGDIEPLVKNQAAAAGKYMQLVSRYLAANGALEGRMRAVTMDLAQAAEVTLNYGLDKFDPGQWEAKNGPPLFDPLRNGDRDVFRLNVIKWVGGSVRQGLLSSELIGIPADKLSLPQPPATDGE